MTGACANFWSRWPSDPAHRPRRGFEPANQMINEPSIWIIFAACLVLSFFLSGMEASVFALSRLRIRQLVRSGAASARVLHGYLENPENFLWTILVGNTVANFLILGWVLMVLHALLAGRRVWILASFALLLL